MLRISTLSAIFLGLVSAAKLTAQVDSLVFLTGNNISCFAGNDGRIAFDFETGNFGMWFTDDPGYSLCFASGFYVSARRPDDQLLVERVRFETEWKGGRILNYLVDPDSLVVEGPGPVFILPQDSSVWPPEAPHDAGGQPLLLSNLDSWTVFNDGDTSRYYDPPGGIWPSRPVGLEVQRMTFQFDDGVLNNSLIIRLRMINKSNLMYDTTFIGIWADADVGSEAAEDLSGSDSLLSLPYSNPAGTDFKFFATGFQILQGPLVEEMALRARPSRSDRAAFSGDHVRTNVLSWRRPQSRN